MRNKLIIGDIPGRKDVSGILFDFMKKWNRTIFPSQLRRFLENKEAAITAGYSSAGINYDGLLDELKIQLLSGAKSFYQFKLFVNGLDYLNPWSCQLEAIADFYNEVFQLEIRLKTFDPRYAKGGNFMFFPHELNFKNNRLFDAWEIYRNGDLNGKRRDEGLRRCEPWYFEYGVPPKSFLQYDLRNANSDYIIYYREKFVTEDLENISRYTYPLIYKPSVVDMRGLTLREVFILSMFEFWKTTKYFSPRKDQEHYLAVPCFGSVCADSTHDELILPIPLVIMTEDEIQSTWAAGRHHIPNFKLAKIYKEEDHFLL